MSKGLNRWTPEEDRLLLEAFQAQAIQPTGKGRTINWNEVAMNLPGRSNKDCRKRYLNEMAGNLKKGAWSKEEDTRLRLLVGKYGLAWAEIAQHMKTRGADQCSKRWHHSLDPELDHRAWTKDENRLLLRALATHKNSWKEIREVHFPARSANNVKNQSTILARRNVKLQSDEAPCCTGSSSSRPYSLTATISSAGSSQADGNEIQTTDQDLSEGPSHSTRRPDEEIYEGEEDGALNPSCPPSLYFTGTTDAEYDFLAVDGLLSPESSRGLQTPVHPEQAMAAVDSSISPDAFSTGTFAQIDYLNCRDSILLPDSSADAGTDKRDGMDWQSGQYAPTVSNVDRHDASSDLPSTALLEQAECRPEDAPKKSSSDSRSRMTVVISEATPATLAEVLKVLMDSQAKVEFQCS